MGLGANHLRILRIDIVNPSFVVAIDGPARAGESTASRLLAERLGFEFLDTGAMYRCVTLAVLRNGIDGRDQTAVADLAAGLTIRLEPGSVWLDDEDVTQAIRTPEVTNSIGIVADNPSVRALLSQWQRQWASGKRVVSEGRDQGTEVFSDSPCKIFLTASDRERARRRHEELESRGVSVSLDEVLAQQSARDEDDRKRAVGGLRVADDAHILITDGMTIDEVVERMSQFVTAKLANAQENAPRLSAVSPSIGQTP